jgi:hypothetical protein
MILRRKSVEGILGGKRRSDKPGPVVAVVGPVEAPRIAPG